MGPSRAKREIGSALSSGRMVVVVGNCEVHYHGRAASKISSGDRLLIIKPDGTFLVHQGSKMAAINYQGPGSRARCEAAGGKVTVISERHKPLSERIEVVFNGIQFVKSFRLRDDESIKVMGTERELSGLLMQDLNTIERGLRPLKRESGQAKGIADIIAEDSGGNIVVVELKRRTAHLAAASQLLRYVSELSKRKGGKVRGILCSPAISPKAKSFLEKEGLEWHRLNYEIGAGARITGVEKKQKSLGEY
jgi:RecB family endonuclease NucS